MTTMIAVTAPLRAVPEVTAGLEHFTVEMARDALSRNTRNRAVNLPHARRMATDILAGAWVVNGEAIRFSDDGELLDGQNRCHAIILANRGIDTFVVRGLPSQAQETMDTGKARRLNDILALRGEKNVRHLAAVLGHTARIRAGNYTTNDAGLSHRALLGILEREPSIREFAALGATVARAVPIPSGLAGALAYQFAQIDADDCEDFVAKLISGSDLPHGHPILALRQRLFDNKASRQQKLPRSHIHALTVKAWNAYREGRDVVQLKWSRGGRNREDFPEPI